MPNLHDGEVSISLNGKDRVLKPTLRAMSVLSKQFGGLAKVRANLVAEEVETISAVIRLGQNLSERDARNLDDEIYANGLTAELLVPLITFVGILSNGGKPLPDAPVDQGPATEGNA